MIKLKLYIPSFLSLSQNDFLKSSNKSTGNLLSKARRKVESESFRFKSLADSRLCSNFVSVAFAALFFFLFQMSYCTASGLNGAKPQVRKPFFIIFSSSIDSKACNNTAAN